MPDVNEINKKDLVRCIRKIVSEMFLGSHDIINSILKYCTKQKEFYFINCTCCVHHFLAFLPSKS